MPDGDKTPDRSGPASLLIEFYRTRQGNSLKMAVDDLRMFAKFCMKQTPEDVESLLFGPNTSKDVATTLVTRYRDHMITSKLAKGTIKRRLSTIRSISKLAESIGVVKWSLSVPTEVAPRVDHQARAQAPKLRFREQQSTKARRDLTISLVARDLRLTRNEVCALDLEHYRLGRVGLLSVMRNGERLTMQISADSTRAMAAWLERRGLQSGALFPPIDLKGNVRHAERLKSDDLGVQAR